MNNKNELIKLINKTDKQFQKNKLKRTIIAFLVLLIVNFIMLSWLEGSFKFGLIYSILNTGVLAIVYTAVLFFVSIIIFGQLFTISKNEENYLKELNKQLSEMQ